jgi:tetratricopeptide (TPR) repeat protein
MFQAQGNHRGQAKALHNQGEAHLRQGRWTDAALLYERSIVIAAEAGDEVGAMRSRTSLAILHHQQGHHQVALELHREIELFYRRLGDRSMLARVINNEGAFLESLGSWEDAALAYEQASRMHQELGNLPDAANSLLNWVELLLNRGETESALARLHQAEELLSALPDAPSQLRFRYAAVQLQTAARQPDERASSSKISQHA